MVEQEQIYNYLKKYKGVKWTSDHLSKVFNCTKNPMNQALLNMINNIHKFPGFKREESIKEAKNGRSYICYLYYVERGDENK